MRSRGRVVTAATGVLLVLWTPSAFADPGDLPGGWVDVDGEDSEVEVGASDEQSQEGSTGGGDSVSECTWSTVPSQEMAVLWGLVGSSVGTEVLNEEGENIEDPLDYDWYWRSCPDAAGGATLDLIPVPREEPPVDPTLLRDEAVERLTLPTPQIAMNPPGDQVVHINSWLWLDDAIWTTHSKSASAGGVTATVTATPRRVVWDLGNGDTVMCDGPGTPYDPARPSAEQATDCSYTYEHTSADQPGDAYAVTATVEWELSWSVQGAAGGGALPALFTSAPMSVRVGELQALNQ